MIPKEMKYYLYYGDVRGDVLLKLSKFRMYVRLLAILQLYQPPALYPVWFHLDAKHFHVSVIL